jgi:hypothetical protein
MSIDELVFFNRKRHAPYTSCPRCKRVNEYRVRWVVNTGRIGSRARRRARSCALRQKTSRLHGSRRRCVTCKTCGKKFDIPSQHSMVFIEKALKLGQVYTGSDDDDTASIDEQDHPPLRHGYSERSHRRSSAGDRYLPGIAAIK